MRVHHNEILLSFRVGPRYEGRIEKQTGLHVINDLHIMLEERKKPFLGIKATSIRIRLSGKIAVGVGKGYTAGENRAPREE